MLVGLIVGVVISLFQALTQIQEMTLVFVPKILAIFVAMLLALPFMGDMLQGHMARLAARIAGGRAPTPWAIAYGIACRSPLERHPGRAPPGSRVRGQASGARAGTHVPLSRLHF